MKFKVLKILNSNKYGVLITIGFFILFLFPQKVLAQVPPCDQVSGYLCTWCYPDITNNTCGVDYGLSQTCYDGGFYPDSSFCGQFNAGNCPTSPGQLGNCTDIPPACQNINQPCIGPAGSTSNCCSGYTCEDVSGNLLCQQQTTIVTGYFSDCGFPPYCYPCYQGSTNPQCNVGSPPHPEYPDYNSCLNVCQGGTKLFSCTQGLCVEDGSGVDFNTCSSSCIAPTIPCTGVNTGIVGECRPFLCPIWDGLVADGKYPNVCLDFPNICCINPIPAPVIRPYLNTNCLNGQPGINTAIGCIPVESNSGFLVFIIPWAIGLAGGTAFILIITSGFLIATSAGDPRKLQAGKELLTASLVALGIIIFSVYILDVVGIRILQLPGF